MARSTPTQNVMRNLLSRMYLPSKPYAMAMAFLILILTLICVSVTSLAAPILPGKRQLSDAVLSMAHLDRVKIIVQPTPLQLRELGITAESVTTTLRRKCEEAAIEVVEAEAGVPQLVLHLSIVTDGEVTDGLTYAYYIRLWQTVHVPRLNRDLFVPTFGYTIVALESLDEVAEKAPQSLDRALNSFIHQIALASNHTS